MGVIRVRLAPSGAPLGPGVPTADSGVYIERLMTAAYNTVLYTCPTGALGRVEGPAGENPAQIQHVIPTIQGVENPVNRWRVFAHLTLHARFRSPAGAPPQAASLSMQLQQSFNGAGFGVPLFLFGDAASGNGTLQHTFANAQESEQTAACVLASDHVFEAAAGDTLDMRAVWLQSGTYNEVVSSFVNEGLANGGWHFESYLALEQLNPAP